MVVFSHSELLRVFVLPRALELLRVFVAPRSLELLRVLSVLVFSRVRRVLIEPFLKALTGERYDL